MIHLNSLLRRCVQFACCIVLISNSGEAQTAVPASADPEAGAVVTLPDFTVTTQANDDRVRAAETIGANRVASRLVETPVAVTVLKPEFLENFQLYHLDEQLPFGAGYLAGEVEAGTTGGGRLRGFSPPTFRNGFRRAGVGEVVNVDRVEVIKGPLSAMVGNASPGGLVNYITRRPQRKPAYSFKTVYGTYDYRRAELHATGPAGGKFFYRVDASHTDLEGVMNYFFNRSSAASAAVTYELSHDTSITFEYERLNYASNPGQGGLVKTFTAVSPVTNTSVSSVVGGVPEGLARAGFNVWGPQAKIERITNTFDLRAEHRINAALSMRLNLQHWTWDYSSFRWTSPNYNVATGIFAARAPFSQTQPRDGSQGQLDFLGSFRVGPTKHRVLLTIDGSEINEKDRQWQFQTVDVNALPASTRIINPSNPDWSGYSDYSRFTRQTRDSDVRTRLFGALLSDRVGLFDDRVLVYGSLRSDNLKVNYVDGLAPANSANKDVQQTSTSFGVAAKIAGDRLVFFANRSSAFDPQTTRDRGTGELQDNVTARGMDIGFKGEILDDQIYWQAMVYRIDREDIPQSNPLFVADVDGDFPPGVSEFIGAGAERSDGWEVEVFGDIKKNFSFTAAVGHVDARTVASLNDPALVGVTLLRVPKLNWSLTTRYRFVHGWLKGVSVGAAVRYTDAYVARYGRFGSEITGTGAITKDLWLNYGPTNRVEEVRPSVTLTNVFVNYGFSVGRYRHTVGLNVNNLFDEEWWTVTGRKAVEREFRVSYGVKF